MQDPSVRPGLAMRSWDDYGDHISILRAMSSSSRGSRSNSLQSRSARLWSQLGQAEALGEPQHEGRLEGLQLKVNVKD